MADCHPNGRLGTTLRNLSLVSLTQLMNHLPSDDPLLMGESGTVIRTRMNALQQKADNADIEFDVSSTRSQLPVPSLQEFVDYIKQHHRDFYDITYTRCSRQLFGEGL